jgi:succinate dehydrogenase/fumarate reductase cytochrome b subunit
VTALFFNGFNGLRLFPITNALHWSRGRNGVPGKCPEMKLASFLHVILGCVGLSAALILIGSALV